MPLDGHKARGRKNKARGCRGVGEACPLTPHTTRLMSSPPSATRKRRWDQQSDRPVEGDEESEDVSGAATKLVKRDEGNDKEDKASAAVAIGMSAMTIEMIIGLRS